VIPTALVGAMTAFAKALVGFLYMLHLMGRDYREAREANKRMADRALDERIFEVCPMLGAAYLAETVPEQRQHLLRLPVTFVDSICAGNPEASGILAAAAASAKRVLSKPKSFREQVAHDLQKHIEPTIADAHAQLGGFGWILDGPNIHVANTPPPSKLSKLMSTLAPKSDKTAAAP
jgi:hypothetical protein